MCHKDDMCYVLFEETMAESSFMQKLGENGVERGRGDIGL